MQCAHVHPTTCCVPLAVNDGAQMRMQSERAEHLELLNIPFHLQAVVRTRTEEALTVAPTLSPTRCGAWGALIWRARKTQLQLAADTGEFIKNFRLTTKLPCAPSLCW